MQVKGKNYLIPVNSGIKREDEVPFRAFDANQLLAKMDSAHNGLNLVILDACRNNPFERSFRSGNEGLAPMDAPSGTLIAYAAKPGMKSKDSDGSNNGLYTGTLLKYITTPNMQIETLLKKVNNDVEQLSNGEQVTWQEGILKSDFCFAGCNGNPTLVSQPEPVPTLQQIAQPLNSAIAIVPFTSQDAPLDVSSVVDSDLTRSGYFKTLSAQQMPSRPSTAEAIKFPDWQAIRQNYVVIGRVIPNDGQLFTVEFQLFDVANGAQLLGYRMGASGNDLREAAHRISDMIYEKILGKKGIFSIQ
jgi:hypothetical protein